MSLTFKRTRDYQSAMEIIEGLGDFFDEDNYHELKSDIKEDIVYGAYENSKMLGFIIFCELNPEVIELTWMAVAKETRGKGVGKQLITYGLNEIKKQDKYKICYLKTIGEGDRQRSFKATREFYLKNGFVALESLKPYPGWHKSKYVQTFVLCLNH